MRKLSSFFFSLLLVACTFGCSTVTTFQSNVPDATIEINGEPLGKTPCTTTLSNALWETYSIKVSKDGYKDIMLSDIRREVKIVPVCFFWLAVPLLWFYGPINYQNYVLTPTNTTPAAN